MIGAERKPNFRVQALTETHRAKPQHLAAEHAAQFGDEEVAGAYRHRPPYPPETFSILAQDASPSVLPGGYRLVAGAGPNCLGSTGRHLTPRRFAYGANTA